MNSEEISCMQSQQSSAHIHSRDNKFVYEGRVVTGTSPALIHHQQLSIDPRLQREGGMDPLSKPNTKTLSILSQSTLIQRHSK